MGRQSQHAPGGYNENHVKDTSIIGLLAENRTRDLSQIIKIGNINLSAKLSGMLGEKRRYYRGIRLKRLRNITNDITRNIRRFGQDSNRKQSIAFPISG
jgi:hypothetical protein